VPKRKNKQHCNCTYDCELKGICCQCIKEHRENGELPACYFTKKLEKTYDRSIENFVKNRERNDN